MKPAPPLPLAAEAWRSLSHEWLWVYRGQTPKSEVWSSEILVPPGVFFVEKGRVIIEAEGRKIEVKPGHAFFSAPGLRRQWMDAGTVLLSVGFRSWRSDGSAYFQAGLNQALSIRQLRALHRATQVLLDQIHPGKSVVTYRQAVLPRTRSASAWSRHDAAFLTWFSVYVETLQRLKIGGGASPSGQEKALAHVLAWLDRCPLDQTQPLRGLTTHVGLSARRVDQLLQAHAGLTARAWIERRRVHVARDLLLRDDTPLKEIGYSLGFRHASHFTAWFRRLHGVAPSVFRTSAGQGAA